MGSINEQEFYDDYDNDIQTMAQGGMTSSLAYVDDGELLNTPQGVIAEVPEEGKPTDSNLVDLPEGTRILSDKRRGICKVIRNRSSRYSYLFIRHSRINFIVQINVVFY